MFEDTISIFTTSKNRPQYLTRLYKSLDVQKNINNIKIQWIIGVDGDTKGTVDVVRQFESAHNNSLSIEVFEFPGIGKHKVLNRLQGMQRGFLTTIVDDDDFLVENAIETIFDVKNRFPKSEEIVFLRGNEKTGKPIRTFPSDEYFGNVFDYRYRDNLVGDYFEVYDTELFNSHTFPEFQSERFISEGTKWQPMSLNANGVFINKVLYLSDYHDDGLTKNVRKLQISNPQGVLFRQKQIFSENRFPIKIRLRSLAMYSLFLNYVDDVDEKSDVDRFLNSNILKIVSLLLRPFSYHLRKKNS